MHGPLGDFLVHDSLQKSCCRNAIADVGVGLQMQATAVRLFLCILGISGCHARVESVLPSEPSS